MLDQELVYLSAGFWMDVVQNRPCVGLLPSVAQTLQGELPDATVALVPTPKMKKTYSQDPVIHRANISVVGSPIFVNTKLRFIYAIAGGIVISFRREWHVFAAHFCTSFIKVQQKEQATSCLKPTLMDQEAAKQNTYHTSVVIHESQRHGRPQCAF